MDKINELLTRGVANIYPSKEKLGRMLRSGKKLTIYIGADATGPQLHLGHSTNFLILRKFQDLGHKIIILIGDFTGMIGDPTDKLATRRQLTREEAIENSKTYKEQVAKILKFEGDNPAEIKFNSEWLTKLTIKDVVELASNLTVQQMIERDMFQKRLEENKPIWLHEFLYPLMQGFDSVHMGVDIEMGGTDQTFNMLVGRTLMRALKDREKFVITTELLINPKTEKKMMNKSEGSYIGLNDPPNVMYAKVMSLPDEAIEPVFRLCTNADLNTINFSDNPLKLKKQLALEITSMYHLHEATQKAREEFERVFQGRELPTEIPTFSWKSNEEFEVTDLLVKTGLTASKTEAKRLVEQGAVEYNKLKIQNAKLKIKPGNGDIIKVGKLKYLKLITT